MKPKHGSALVAWFACPKFRKFLQNNFVIVQVNRGVHLVNIKMCVSGQVSRFQLSADPRGSKVHIFGFSLNIQGISSFSGLLMTIFHVLLHHLLEQFDPFEPFDSGVKDSYHCFVSNFVENAGDEAFYILGAQDHTFGEFRLHEFEGEELTWRWI
jgi:hypothetical protein